MPVAGSRLDVPRGGRRLVLELAVVWLVQELFRRFRSGRLGARLSVLLPAFLRYRTEAWNARKSSFAIPDTDVQFSMPPPMTLPMPVTPPPSTQRAGSKNSCEAGTPKASSSARAFARQESLESEIGADRELFVGCHGAGLGARCGDHKLVLAMVGLPARGKSYITRHLQRYLSFEGLGVKVFNAGDRRRRMLGSGQSAGFFDPSNPAGLIRRQQLALESLEECISWLMMNESAHVGILDATNSTTERREAILKRCHATDGVRVAFLESICTNEEVLQQNYAMKLRNADYSGWDEEAARKDFQVRAAMYETSYQTVDECEDGGQVSFMKILNCGEKTVHRRCEGFLVSKVAGYLLNLHIERRVIYLTRHGESEDNRAGRIGGDATLTHEGMAFGESLRDFIRKRFGWEGEETDTESIERGWLLITSQLRRTRMTARPLLADAEFVRRSGLRRVHTALLNEIVSGTFDGYSAERIKQEAPQEHDARQRDKLRYRYPKGESYLDVVQRVRPVLLDLDRERRPAVMIAHQAVLRTVLAFFLGTPLEDMPQLEIPLHTVLQLVVTPHGCDVTHIELPAKPGPSAGRVPKMAPVPSNEAMIGA